jgi:flagellar hook-associated protein 2
MPPPDSILGAIVAQSQSKAGAVLGPSRIAATGRSANDLQGRQLTSTTPGAELHARLLRVRAAAQRLLTFADSAAQATATASTGVRVASSRPDAVSAQAIDGSSRGSEAVFMVKVTNLARAQVNEGTVLDATDTNTMQAGTNTFGIAIGSRTAETVAFTNDSTDTNEEALEKLASAINEAAAGVDATVRRDEDAGTVQLVLTASETGLPHGFELSDTVGDVVATTGVAAVATAAENAQFVLDDVARSADTNTVLIDDGRVRLTFKAETGPSGGGGARGVAVAVGPDPMSAAVLELTGALNDLRDFLAADPVPGAAHIRSTFDGLLEREKTGLETIGILLQGTGRLYLDRDVLEAAVADARKRVEDVVGSRDGIGAKVVAAAEASLSGARQADAAKAPLSEQQLLTAGPDALPGVLIDVFG